MVFWRFWALDLEYTSCPVYMGKVGFCHHCSLYTIPLSYIAYQSHCFFRLCIQKPVLSGGEKIVAENVCSNGIAELSSGTGFRIFTTSSSANA
jgi:hypothetical protein